MKKVGLADEYIEQLGPWHEMIAKGLTTFEEGDYDERSDCHAWGSTPNYDLLATVSGIRPAAPGFSKIEIAPAFGKLTFIKAKMPHPKGTIEVNLQKSGNGISGFVSIPENTTGVFRWNGKTMEFKGGKMEIEM
jgi:hypothetical protein